MRGRVGHPIAFGFEDIRGSLLGVFGGDGMNFSVFRDWLAYFNFSQRSIAIVGSKNFVFDIANRRYTFEVDG